MIDLLLLYLDLFLKFIIGDDLVVRRYPSGITVSSKTVPTETAVKPV